STRRAAASTASPAPTPATPPPTAAPASAGSSGTRSSAPDPTPVARRGRVDNRPVGGPTDLAFMATGLLFGGLGLYVRRRNQDLQEHGQRVIGVVDSLDVDRLGDDDSVHPVLRFRTAEGRELVVRSDMSSTRFRPGDELVVVYDPDDLRFARPEA